MKLFKLTEQSLQLILLHLGEFPIKHEQIVKGIMDILKGLEEIIEPVKEE